MLWVRGLIYGFPLIIIVLLVLSFRTASDLKRFPRNELSLGNGAEARMLNPILSTSTADSTVEQFIFNALIKYSEDLELVGDLAKSWEMNQSTTIFGSSHAAADEIAATLEELREQWDGWGLTDVMVDGREVMLSLDMPGTRVPDEILDLLEPELVEPISMVNVALAEAARESLQHFLENAVTAEYVARSHVESSNSYSLVVPGDPQPVIDELINYYEANTELEAKVAQGEELRALNEPQIIFHLRDNVVWHDGQPLTSADAEFTYRMIMDESVASPRRPSFELVSSVETPDEHTFVVNYRKPYSSALISWGMELLPKHILEGQSTSWWAQNFNRSPIGTGPFQFSEWRSNEYIELVRNDEYYAGKPHLEKVVIRPIPDQVAMRLAFQTGQVDLWQVDAHAVKSLRDDDRYELFANPRPSYQYIGWNLRRPLFQDQRVRQALAQAVNIDQIIEYIAYRFGVQSTGPFVPQTWFFNDEVKPLPFDPQRARELLAQAGWQPGEDGILEKNGEKFSFTLTISQGSEIRKDIATLVQSDLKAIGIEIEIEIFEWTVFIENVVRKQNFDAVVLGWSLSFDYDQYQLWHSSQTAPGMLNAVGYESARVDELLDQIRTEFDKDEIKKLCGELQQLVYTDQPYLFLYVDEAIGATHSGTYRVKRPDDGEWIDEDVQATKAGFTYHINWWYRPDYEPVLTY